MLWSRHLRRRPKIMALEPAALGELLRGFEDDHFDRTGERITSAEFYDRYRADDDAFDTFESMQWASYYELLRAQGQEALLAQGDKRAVRRRTVVA